MADPFGREQRPSLLARLFRPRASGPMARAVRVSENLTFVVAEANAADVQDAIELWLASHGIETTVSAAPPADGKVRLAAHIGFRDAAKLDIQNPVIQDEMQRVLIDAAQSSKPHPTDQERGQL